MERQNKLSFDYSKYIKLFTADFETSTQAWGEDRARVWLWDICDKGLTHTSGTSIEEFLDYVLDNPETGRLYAFHNLAYDGMYILDYLLNHGYKYVENCTKSKSFHTVISDLGQHYAYQVRKNGGIVTFVDSYKSIHQSVADIAKTYNLPILKGEIDYDEVRPINNIPTEEELAYIHNDTEIVMRALLIKLKGGETKFTQPANAKASFKESIGKDFKNYFPIIELDDDKRMRLAYTGGFTYVNPKFSGKDLDKAISLDCNSMYPAQMLHEPMPYGYPREFAGKYEYDEEYPLYVQELYCIFELKPDGIPMISSRRVMISMEHIYLSSSKWKVAHLVLASPDLELFLDNYNVYEMKYAGGFKFKARKGYEVTEEEARGKTVDEIIDMDGRGSFFYEYFKKWRTIKEHSEGAIRLNAKLMQNGLYGVFATNPVKRSAIPYLRNDKISFYVSKPEEKHGMYLPIGIFVTAWARYMLINYIKKYKDRFIYCDTDSLYLLGDEIPKGIKIHDSLYGYFKIEHIIDKARFLGAKRYIYYARTPKNEEYQWNIACCGADKAVKDQMNWDNFIPNQEFYGKKSIKTVEGGKHIGTTTYKLKVL